MYSTRSRRHSWRRQLIGPRRAPLGRPTFSFTHALVRDVAYEGMLKARAGRSPRALRRLAGAHRR